MSLKDRDQRVNAFETESFEVLPGRIDHGLIVVCDHAANTIPDQYGNLGLPPDQLERHIAYDIGAGAVTRGLNKALDVPAVLTRFSRLLIDPNRGEDDPTLIMRLSDGAIVPGNRHLTEADRAERVSRYLRPYHQAITDIINQGLTAGIHPTLLAVHSFTESWKGVPRPWAASILWANDDRLARPLLAALNAEPALVIGENEPYPGQYEGDTMWRHGTCQNLPHAIIEIRQDLIRDETGQAAWVDRLARILKDIAQEPALTMNFD